MIIKRVKLQNFRSHDGFVLDCDTHTTKIVGENGCGKTSILEAIYEAMQGKSFRAVDREIVRRGDEFYRVELEYEDGRKVVVIFDGDKKSFWWRIKEHGAYQKRRNIQLYYLSQMT